MDWPVVGAITGVTALAITVGAGAYVAFVSSPAMPVAQGRTAPVLVKERMASSAALAPVAPLPEAARPSGLRVGALPATDAATSRPPRLVDPPPAPPPQARPHAVPPPAAVAPEQIAPARPPRPAAPAVQRPDPRYGQVLTIERIAYLRAGLRLRPEQLPHWGAVEAALRAIAQEQAAQIRRGQPPDVQQAAIERLYWAARPLLGTLNEVQKERVRALARSLGYAQVASMI